MHLWKKDTWNAKNVPRRICSICANSPLFGTTSCDTPKQTVGSFVNCLETAISDKTNVGCVSPLKLETQTQIKFAA